MADNRDHSFFYNNIEDPTRAALTWSRANNLDPTEINTFNEANGVNSLTDVVVFDANYGGEKCGLTWISAIGGSGLLGFAECRSLTGSKCQQFYVEFDTQYMGPRSDDAERTLACHELGHTVGLDHRTMDTTCMKDPLIVKPGYDDHDRVHLHNYL